MELGGGREVEGRREFLSGWVLFGSGESFGKSSFFFWRNKLS